MDQQQPGQPAGDNTPQGAAMGPAPGSSGGESSSSGGGRGPVDTRGLVTPPPPPGAGAFPPPMGFGPWGQPPRRRFNLLNLAGQLLVLAILLMFAAGMGYSAAMKELEGGAIEEYPYQSGDEKAKIVIIPIDGFIDDNASVFMHQCVEQAMDDDSIKAVVLRVNSGGGMVGPSEEMAHELERLKEGRPKLPIVASYGEVAASGAYYASCGAEEIYAQPACVTGSIGVIAQVLTFDKLLNEKLGIKPEVLTASTSPKKDVANDVMRNWNADDRADVQHLLDVMHKRFIEVVKRGRGHVMSDEQLKTATQGQVFTAQEAVDAGLVDHVGHLSDAIDAAADLAKIATDVQPLVVEYGWRPAGLLTTLVGSADRRTHDMKAGLTLDAASLRRAMGEIGSPQMLYVYRP